MGRVITSRGASEVAAALPSDWLVRLSAIGLMARLHVCGDTVDLQEVEILEHCSSQEMVDDVTVVRLLIAQMVLG